MAKRAPVVLLATGVFLLSPQAAFTQTVNDKVVDFCKQQLGKQVGGGECSHLVEVCFTAVEAKARTSFKDFPNNGDYVWGDLVYALEVKDGVQIEHKVTGKRVRPGDVIQFRDARFAGKKSGGGAYTKNAGHHTAVVIEVRKGGKELKVLHQNWNNKRYVTETTFYLTDVQTGWIRIYTPVPK